MRVVVQRVTEASVEIGNSVVGEIGRGVLLLVGAGREDVAGGSRAGGERPGVAPGGAAHTGSANAAALAEKVAHLRIFPDADGKSNLSLLDIGGAALVISQFTLYADYRRGRRPSFTDAADPGPAEALVEEFRLALERLGVPTAAGRFGAHMKVALINDGPYTILLDSEILAGPRDRRRPGEGD
jgi:D-tyrosyl-tRNA(Tyr) deacylase